MITLTTTFKGITLAQLYNAWLIGTKHTAMTGAKATGSAKVGAQFTAWDGYIWGKNLKLLKDKQIVQSWRTTEFEDSDPDSSLTITLKQAKTGTELKLQHKGTPKSQEAAYRQGWHDHYFMPMQDYFIN